MFTMSYAALNSPFLSSTRCPPQHWVGRCNLYNNSQLTSTSSHVDLYDSERHSSLEARLPTRWLGHFLRTPCLRMQHDAHRQRSRYQRTASIPFGHTWVCKPGYKGRMLTGTKLQVTHTLLNGPIGTSSIHFGNVQGSHGLWIRNRGEKSNFSPSSDRGSRSLFALPVASKQREDINPTTFTPISSRMKLHGGTTTHDDPMHPWILMDGLELPASSLEPGQPFPAEPEPGDEPDGIHATWGTLVNLHNVTRIFRQFLQGFKPKCQVAHEREQGRPTSAYSIDENEELLYETYLCRMRQDMVNIYTYPPAKELHSRLIKFPEEFVAIMAMALKDSTLELAERDQEAGLDRMEGAEGDEEIGTIMISNYGVRPFGVTPVNIRNLNPTDADKLVCIKGLVIRATPVFPEMQQAFFRPLACSHTMQVDFGRGKIEESARCPCDVCSTVGSMSLIYNRSTYSGRQVIRLVCDELVDVAKPGDRVVTGVFRTTLVRVNPRQRSLKSLFKAYIDLVHNKIGADGTLGMDKTTRGGTSDRVPGVGGVGDVEGDDHQMCDGLRA
ncbi:MCM DNA helicase complex subunit [Marasmius sp. AFHP31]|nr:MCM DNA helicase complex subunit [Marasmius sp. AFHP31]